MGPFTWSPALVVDEATIDGQHKELFLRIERFNRAEGKGRIKETLRFLEGHAVEHIGTEERKMAEHRYPGSGAHRRRHETFIANLGETKKRFDESGASSSVLIAFQNDVCRWLLEHITTMDRALASHLKKAA